MPRRVGTHGVRVGATAVRAALCAQDKSVGRLDVSGFIDGSYHRKQNNVHDFIESPPFFDLRPVRLSGMN